MYAPGDELRAYARHCADKYDVRRRIRFGTRVVGAVFDETAHVWRLTTDGGDELTARFVIGATGVFSQPKPPDIPGLDVVRRPGDPHRALGPLAGPRRQARRDHRHRRLGGPGDSRDRARRRAADRLPAHPDLVHAQARRRAAAAAALAPVECPRQRPRGARAQPVVRRAVVHARRPFRRRAARQPPGRAHRPQAPRRAGPRPGDPRQADAALRARLQAAELPQRVPGDVQPRQRHLDTSPIDRHRRVGDRDRRGPPGPRRAHPRDRLQAVRRRQHAALPGASGAAASTSPTGGTRTASRPTRARASPGSRTCSRSSGRTRSTARRTST